MTHVVVVSRADEVTYVICAALDRIGRSEFARYDAYYKVADGRREEQSLQAYDRGATPADVVRDGDGHS